MAGAAEAASGSSSWRGRKTVQAGVVASTAAGIMSTIAKPMVDPLAFALHTDVHAQECEDDFVVGSSATSPRNQEVWSIRRALDSPAGRSAIERRRQTPGRKSQPAGRMNNTGEDAK